MSRITIDIHAHYTSPRCLRSKDALIDDEAVSESMAHGEDVLLSRISDLGNRSQWMKQKRIDFQILGPELRFLSPLKGTKKERAWAERVNDSVAEDIDGCREFAALALLPLADGESAASELKRSILTLGMCGGMIYSQPDGGLASPHLEPLWETATNLNVPIVLHSWAAAADPRLSRFDLDIRLGRCHDVGVAAAELIFGGVLDRFEGLKIVLATGGGSLPFVLARLDRHHRMRKETSSDLSPSEYVSRLYFDSLVFGRSQLKLLLEIAGADHVMMGSDWPIPLHEDDPRQLILSLGSRHLTRDQESSVLAGTANTLFSLQLPRIA